MTIVRSLSNIFLAWLIKRAEVMSSSNLDVFYQIHFAAVRISVWQWQSLSNEFFVQDTEQLETIL